VGITMEIYKDIRKMGLEGFSQRQIAARLHISRNTVKKYWHGDCVSWKRKEYSRYSAIVTENVIEFVRNCRNADEAVRLKEQHHTVKRIYDRRVDELGFTGGESTIRRLVQELRVKALESFVPIAFPPGDAMQVDWGEATIYLNNAKAYCTCSVPGSATAVPHLYVSTTGRTRKASLISLSMPFNISTAYQNMSSSCQAFKTADLRCLRRNYPSGRQICRFWGNSC